MPISVAIVEDNGPYRETLRVLLTGTPQFRCAGVCSSAEEAIKLLPVLEPDVVLMDLELPKQSGIVCIRELAARKLRSRLVVLTNFDDPERIFAALRAGAIGYILKRASLPEIIEAIQEAHAGGGPMTPQIARRVLESFHKVDRDERLEPLTAREQEILLLAKKGLRYRQIAEELGISYDTVRTHFNRIYEKLHAHSRAEALMKFSEAGFPFEAGTPKSSAGIFGRNL